MIAHEAAYFEYLAFAGVGLKDQKPGRTPADYVSRLRAVERRLGSDINPTTAGTTEAYETLCSRLDSLVLSKGLRQNTCRDIKTALRHYRDFVLAQSR